MGDWGHLFPGFLQGGDNFVVGGFRREVGELMFKEDETERVFEHATFRVGRKILF